MRLFEVIQLQEYNKQATLNKWGERIAQAAKFNKEHMDDQWLNSLGPVYDEKDYSVKIVGKIIDEFEKMDPTKNKQYVMTLVRWYVGNIKKHNQLQAQYDDWREDENMYAFGDENHPDSRYPEDYYDMVMIADEFDDFHDDFGNYVMNPQNLDTFKLEDSEQIKTALQRFDSMKPQLQPNERDIGRFKTFYRFEDFVDSKMDPDAKAEIEDELLKRSDVETLYNGPMGTVTIPRSKEASCELGKGTKWCTAGSTMNMYSSYAERGDLIIYNEKPGNAKYQFHMDINRLGSGRGIEATDARDRQLSFKQMKYFQEEHPVMSKIITAQIVKMLNSQYMPEKGDNWNSVKNLFVLNRQHGGGIKKYLDGFIIHHMKRVEKDRTSNTPEFIEQSVAYAQDRGKPWPAFEEMSITHLNRFFMSVMADKAKYSKFSGLGAPGKGDSLMNLVRDNVIGPMGKTIKRYLEKLLIYKDKVNPNWKGIDNFVTAYQNAMSKERDVVLSPQEKERRNQELAKSLPDYDPHDE